ncbi:MAG: DUF3857 domain-containing protein [bacterium]
MWFCFLWNFPRQRKALERIASRAGFSWVAILVCLLFGTQALAQEEPLKWGEVSRADLEMKSFPADSDAAAMILCDYGEVSFDSEFELNFQRHRRIKILSPAGYDDWGSFTIQYYAKDRVHRVEDVEGQTIILEPNGKVRREKLDKKSVFDEDVDGEWRRVRFALPALTTGAVVEYRYRLHSKNPAWLEEWEFQNSEPTRWSEFRAEIPGVLHYIMVRQELLSFDVQESTDHPWPPTMSYAQTAKAYNIKFMHHRWAVKDMPALREEQFMTTPDDYRAKMRFQLAGIKWPDSPERKYMHTWEKLAEERRAILSKTPSARFRWITPTAVS